MKSANVIQLSVVARLAFFLVFLGLANESFAQRNWTGGGDADRIDWNYSPNWDFPTFTVGGTFSFSGNNKTTNFNNLGDDVEVNLSFDDSNSFTMSGDRLKLGNVGDLFNTRLGLISVNQSVTSSHNIDFDLKLDNSTTFSTVQGGALNVGGTIKGDYGFTKTGDGVVTLTGINEYLGLTNISGGTLTVKNGDALGSAANGTVVATGATLSLDGGVVVYNEALELNGNGFGGGGALSSSGGHNNFSGNINVASSARINAVTIDDSLSLDGIVSGSLTGTQALTFGGAGDITVSQGVSLDQGGLVKDGTGTLTLSGLNDYSGATNVNAGVLQLGDGSSDGLLTNTSSIVVAQNANITFNSGSNLIQGQEFSSAVISGQGSLTKNGQGNLVFTANHTYQGTTNINEGALVLGYGGSTGSLLNSSGINISENASLVIFRDNDVIQGGVGATGLTSGLITGEGSFVHAGSGRVVLTENNTFSGDTIVLQGALVLGGDSPGGGTKGSLMSTNSITLDPGASLVINRSNDLIQGSSDSVTGFTSGAIQGGNLIQQGEGRTVLTSNDNYVDTVQINDGTLQIGLGADTGRLSTSTDIVVGANGTLEVNRGSGLGVLSQENVIGNGSIGFSKITGDGAFTKSGDSTFVLTANNDYKGTTTVAGGSLVINGDHSLATGEIIVSSGATLVVGTTGTINSVTTVSTGGTFIADGSVLGATTIAGTLSGSGTFNSLTTINGVHSPGNSPGMQIFNAGLTYGNNSSIQWELFDTSLARGTGYDAIDVMGGDLTFNGSTTLDLFFGPSILWTDAFWTSNQSWRLFYVAGGSSAIVSPGTFSLNVIDWADGAGNLLSGSPLAGSSFNLVQDDDGFIIRFDSGVNAIPEPGSLTLMSVIGLFGGGRLVQRYIRRRKKPEASAC